jgi:hypothetical protein
MGLNNIKLITGQTHDPGFPPVSLDKEETFLPRDGLYVLRLKHKT